MLIAQCMWIKRRFMVGSFTKPPVAFLLVLTVEASVRRKCRRAPKQSTSRAPVVTISCPVKAVPGPVASPAGLHLVHHHADHQAEHREVRREDVDDEEADQDGAHLR